VTFTGEHIGLQATTLGHPDANNLVTSATVTWEALYNFMIHTSTIVPPELRPGPAGAPDYGKCWHCHTNNNGVVTMFHMGKFHFSLDRYTVTPDAPITPLPQPTQGCRDCHADTRPTGIIGPSSLQPMNHGVELASPVTVAGEAPTGVKDLDCSTCHHDPTGGFGDGQFHTNIAASMLPDCVSCHYVTMADGPTADVANGTAYQMKHTSAQLSFQTCTTCHPSALANAVNPTIAPETWKTGQYHAVLSVQPTECSDCHSEL
jgi:hypothetical protein